MVKRTKAARLARLSVRCVNPPEAPAPLRFGLQAKDQTLADGQAQADGSLRFTCELEVKRREDGTLDFIGAFAHGTPANRFLYLTLQDEWQIIRRIKVKLNSISEAQLKAAGVLEVSVDGRGAASVPLLDGGWQAAG